MAIIHGFHFSDGNAKMGKHVGNFSVLGKITCPYNVPCRKDCYMNGIRDYRKSVHEAYSGNKLLITVYEGDKSGKGKRSKTDCWQENRRVADYLEEVEQATGYKARIENSVIIAEKEL